MKHIAAYLLLQLGGNESPSASDIKELLDTVGIEPDTERLEKLISELQGKDIAQVSLIYCVSCGVSVYSFLTDGCLSLVMQLISEGAEKLASVPSGGGGAAAGGAAPAAGAAAGGAAEEKKEEKEEEKEESDDDMGFGLFD